MIYKFLARFKVYRFLLGGAWSYFDGQWSKHWYNRGKPTWAVSRGYHWKDPNISRREIYH